jgi:hypothetical protein
MSRPCCMQLRKSWVVLFVVLLAFACGKDKGKDGEDKGLGAKHGGIPTSGEGQMYMFGQKLAQAAMVNGRAKPDLVERTFTSASKIAEIMLSTKLDPLPTPTGDRASDGAENLHYLLGGQGKKLAPMIEEKYGATGIAAYELAIKVNMLPMLYIDDPKDKMADTMIDVFTRLGQRLKLPDSALGPIIAKMKARAPMKEVTDLALDLNKSLPVAIAEIYEKAEPKK